MWFIQSWLYRRRYNSLPFKMRNFTESYQSECRESIKEQFKRITREIENKWVRIKLKDAKDNMHAYTTNLLGARKPVKKPIFTEDEVSRISRHRVIYAAVLLLFIALETFFYSFFGSLLLSKQLRSVWAVYVLGAALALAFAFVLHFAFLWIFEYLEAKYIVEKENLEKTELKPFRSYLVLGVIFCALFIVVNLAVGFLRADLLDPVSNSTSAELGEKIHYSWRAFAVLFTFIIALLMAAIEKEIASKSERWAVYKNWKKQQKERKVYNTAIKNMLRSCEQEKMLLVEKYWAVMKDLQRVFGIEIDNDKENLLEELNTKIEVDKGFLQNLDEEDYQHFLPVAATRRELFAYGIETDKDISAVLEDLRGKVGKIEEFETKNSNVFDDKKADLNILGDQNKTLGETVVENEKLIGETTSSEIEV